MHGCWQAGRGTCSVSTRVSTLRRLWHLHVATRQLYCCVHEPLHRLTVLERLHLSSGSADNPLQLGPGFRLPPSITHLHLDTHRRGSLPDQVSQVSQVSMDAPTWSSKPPVETGLQVTPLDAWLPLLPLLSVSLQVCLTSHDMHASAKAAQCASPLLSSACSGHKQAC